MIWSSLHDEVLCRVTMVVNTFTGTQKNTVARGKEWEEVAENLNYIESVYFKVDKRVVRDRCNLLARTEKQIEKKASGIGTTLSSIDVALEEFTVLFLYSCILMSFLQIKTNKNIHMKIPGSWRKFCRIVELIHRRL